MGVSHAQTVRNSSQNGNWNANTTWGNQTFPNAANVNANISHIVTVNSGSTFTAGIININNNGQMGKGAGSASTINADTIFVNAGGNFTTINSSNTFTINAVIIVNGGTLNLSNSMVYNRNIIVNSGNATIQTNDNVNANVVVNGGTLTNNGTITGTVTINGGTYSGNGAVNGGFIQVNLDINNDTTLVANITVINNLNINNNATVNTNGFKVQSAKNVNINGRLRVKNSGGLIGPNGAFPDNPVINLGPNSEVIFSADTGTQTITPRSDYRGLRIENASNKVLSGNTTVLGTLTLANNGKLNIGNNILTINGNFAGNADASLRGGPNAQLQITGSGAIGNLFFDNTNPGQTNMLNKLTVNRNNQTITLGNRVEIVGDVEVNNGTLNSNDNLVLVSNANGTARISAGHNRVNGKVIAQRHIPEVARRWRFIGVPVQNDTIGSFRRSIFVTGPGGTANGFDASSNNAHTIFHYNESAPGTANQGWVGPVNTSEVIPVGRGYRVFVRGDRSNPQRMSNTTLPQNQVTLEFIGELNSGNINMPVSFTANTGIEDDGWCLLANPYASAFNWDAFYNSAATTKTNISPTIWVFDAQGNNYRSYNAISKSGTLANGIIPQGAAFWVKATAPNPQLILSDAFTTGLAGSQVFKTVEDASFGMRLQGDSINFDEITVKYIAGATDSLDQFDILKMFSGISLSAWGADNKQLSHSSLPLKLSSNDTIRLAVSGNAGAYSLSFINTHAIAIKDQVFLVDNFASQIIDLNATSSYSFNITTNPASQGINRFYIVVANNNTIPVDLVHFGAVLGENIRVRINWTTASEINTSHFEIERSEDGTNYTTLGSINATGSKGVLTNYSSVDENPQAINFYRLKMVDNDGTFKYSQVRRVSLSDQSDLISIQLYPMPVAEQLTIAHNQAGIKEVKLYGMWGQLLSSKKAENKHQVQFEMSNYPAGTYMIEITDETGNITREQIIKE